MTFEELLKEMKHQKVEMTPQERMQEYMNGNEVDCIPYMLVGPDTTAGLYGYTLKQERENSKIHYDIVHKLNQEFGITPVGLGVYLKGIGEAVGSKMCYPENSLDYVQEHYLKNYNQLDEMEIIKPFDCPNLKNILDRFEGERKIFPNWSCSNGIAGPLSTAVSIRNAELLLRDMVKNVDELNKLLDYCVMCNLEWVKTVTEKFGAIPTGISEPMGSLSVISKKQFMKFEKPYLKKLVDGIKEITGIMPTIHICGKTKGIWDELIELGFDFLSVDNCEDLEEVKKMVGNKMLIAGNVPPVDILKLGTIDDVINSVRNCLKKASDSPNGYILAAGCQIPPGVRRENLYAYIYAARKYGKDAKKGQMPKGLE